MSQIERTVVASGIIGRFDNEWTVIKLYDRKNNSTGYNLYINKEYVDCFPSVVDALARLVERFEEA